MVTVPKYITVTALILSVVIVTVIIFDYIDDSEIKVVRELPACNNEPRPPIPDVEGIAWNLDECYYFLDDPSIPYELQRVLDICFTSVGKAYDFKSFDNGTHYIDITYCEWKTRDLPGYPGKGFFEDESNSKSNTQISVEEELLEIETTHCSLFEKYDYYKGKYLTKENESIAQQKLEDCIKQKYDEVDFLQSLTCHELSEKSKNGSDELEYGNKLIVQRLLKNCINYEGHDANVGTCQSLSERYRTGEPYLDIANRLLTEQKLQDICHYDLEEKFGNLYEDDFEIDYTEKFN